MASTNNAQPNSDIILDKVKSALHQFDESISPSKATQALEVKALRKLLNDQIKALPSITPQAKQGFQTRFNTAFETLQQQDQDIDKTKAARVMLKVFGDMSQPSPVKTKSPSPTTTTPKSKPSTPTSQVAPKPRIDTEGIHHMYDEIMQELKSKPPNQEKDSERSRARSEQLKKKREIKLKLAEKRLAMSVSTPPKHSLEHHANLSPEAQKYASKFQDDTARKKAKSAQLKERSAQIVQELRNMIGPASSSDITSPSFTPRQNQTQSSQQPSSYFR